MAYYLVSNESECHNGIEYRTGLNKDFRDLDAKPCNGLHFVDAKDVPRFCQGPRAYPCTYRCDFVDCAAWIRPVTLPQGQPGFTKAEVETYEGRRWRANMVVLGERRSCKLASTYIELGLDMPSLWHASTLGAVDILEWHRASGKELKCSAGIIDAASALGHVEVLDWWYRTSQTLPWHQSIHHASVYGHAHVLRWWSEVYGLGRYDIGRYHKEAIRGASARGHVDVLRWWNSRRPDYFNSPYSGRDLVIDVASRHGQVAVLAWAKDSGLPVDWSQLSHDFRKPEHREAVMAWLESCGLLPDPDAEYVDELLLEQEWLDDVWDNADAWDPWSEL